MKKRARGYSEDVAGSGDEKILHTVMAKTSKAYHDKLKQLLPSGFLEFLRTTSKKYVKERVEKLICLNGFPTSENIYTSWQRYLAAARIVYNACSRSEKKKYEKRARQTLKDLLAMERGGQENIKSEMFLKGDDSDWLSGKNAIMLPMSEYAIQDEKGERLEKMLELLEDNKIICPLATNNSCKKELSTFANIVEHFDQLHPVCTIFACSLCHKGFSSKQLLNRHTCTKFVVKKMAFCRYVMVCSSCGIHFSVNVQESDTAALRNLCNLMISHNICNLRLIRIYSSMRLAPGTTIRVKFLPSYIKNLDSFCEQCKVPISNLKQLRDHSHSFEKSCCAQKFATKLDYLKHLTDEHLEGTPLLVDFISQLGLRTMLDGHTHGLNIDLKSSAFLPPMKDNRDAPIKCASIAKLLETLRARNGRKNFKISKLSVASVEGRPKFLNNLKKGYRLDRVDRKLPICHQANEYLEYFMEEAQIKLLPLREQEKSLLCKKRTLICNCCDFIADEESLMDAHLSICRTDLDHNQRTSSNDNVTVLVEDGSLPNSDYCCFLDTCDVKCCGLVGLQIHLLQAHGRYGGKELSKKAGRSYPAYNEELRKRVNLACYLTAEGTIPDTGMYINTVAQKAFDEDVFDFVEELPARARETSDGNRISEEGSLNEEETSSAHPPNKRRRVHMEQELEDERKEILTNKYAANLSGLVITEELMDGSQSEATEAMDPAEVVTVEQEDTNKASVDIGDLETLKMFDKTCPYCGLYFTKDRHLKSHIELHSELSRDCKICNKEFGTFCDLFTHYLTEHAKPVPKDAMPDYKDKVECKVCQMIHYKWTIFNHFVYDCYMAIRCGICGEENAKKKRNVSISHMKTVHKNEYDRFTCGCKKTFFHYFYFKVHECDRRPGGGKCTHCKMVFKMKSDAAKHVMAEHANFQLAENNRKQCQLCMRIVDSHSMISHCANHVGEPDMVRRLDCLRLPEQLLKKLDLTRHECYELEELLKEKDKTDKNERIIARGFVMNTKGVAVKEARRAESADESNTETDDHEIQTEPPHEEAEEVFDEAILENMDTTHIENNNNEPQDAVEEVTVAVPENMDTTQADDIEAETARTVCNNQEFDDISEASMDGKVNSPDETATPSEAVEDVAVSAETTTCPEPPSFFPCRPPSSQDSVSSSDREIIQQNAEETTNRDVSQTEDCEPNIAAPPSVFVIDAPPDIPPPESVMIIEQESEPVNQTTQEEIPILESVANGNSTEEDAIPDESSVQVADIDNADNEIEHVAIPQPGREDMSDGPIGHCSVPDDEEDLEVIYEDIQTERYQSASEMKPSILVHPATGTQGPVNPMEMTFRAAGDDDDDIQIADVETKAELPFKCADCSKCFRKAEGLRNHIIKDHAHDCKDPLCENDYGLPRKGIFYLCPFEVTAFENSERFNKHMETHKKNVTYKCPYCTAVSIVEDTMVKHIELHQTNKLEYRCTRCKPNLIFDKEHLIFEHLRRTHNAELIYFCKGCGHACLEAVPVSLHIMNNTCGLLKSQQADCTTLGIHPACDVTYQPHDPAAHEENLKENPDNYMPIANCSHRSFTRHGESFTTCHEFQHSGCENCVGLIQYTRFASIIHAQYNNGELMSNQQMELVIPSRRAENCVDPYKTIPTFINELFKKLPPSVNRNMPNTQAPQQAEYSSCAMKGPSRPVDPRQFPRGVQPPNQNNNGMANMNINQIPAPRNIQSAAQGMPPYPPTSMPQQNIPHPVMTPQRMAQTPQMGQAMMNNQGHPQGFVNPNQMTQQQFMHLQMMLQHQQQHQMMRGPNDGRPPPPQMGPPMMPPLMGQPMGAPVMNGQQMNAHPYAGMPQTTQYPNGQQPPQANMNNPAGSVMGPPLNNMPVQNGAQLQAAAASRICVLCLTPNARCVPIHIDDGAKLLNKLFQEYLSLRSYEGLIPEYCQYLLQHTDRPFFYSCPTHFPHAKLKDGVLEGNVVPKAYMQTANLLAARLSMLVHSEDFKRIQATPRPTTNTKICHFCKLSANERCMAVIDSNNPQIDWNAVKSFTERTTEKLDAEMANLATTLPKTLTGPLHFCIRHMNPQSMAIDDTGYLRITSRSPQIYIDYCKHVSDIVADEKTMKIHQNNILHVVQHNTILQQTHILQLKNELKALQLVNRCQSQICEHAVLLDSPTNRLFHQMHIQNNLFLCSVCSHETKDEKEFVEHMMQNHNLHRQQKVTFRLQCPLAIECKVHTRFSSFQSLRKHLHTAHGNKLPHPSNVCAARFSTEANARQHDLEHSSDEYYCCYICGLSGELMSNEDRQRHYLAHSLIMQDRFGCQVCCETFTTEVDLLRHFKSNHVKSMDNKTEKCVCGRSCEQITTAHIQRYHRLAFGFIPQSFVIERTSTFPYWLGLDI